MQPFFTPLRSIVVGIIGITALAMFALGDLVSGGPTSAAVPDKAVSSKKPQQDNKFKSRLPRIKPTSPNKTAETFVIAAGYKMELLTSEPLVNDPVAFDFDAAGRLYVAEMRDYSEQDKEKLGRVRRLEDTNGDGRFDRSIIFASGLSWPTAIICYDGGVFVGAAPDIRFLKDTDGDGKADENRVVFTGFGRSNVQGLLNSFRWGLDNRIHGATSSSGAQLRVVGKKKPTKPLSLRGRAFSFDPRTLDLRAESGGAQHGMSFDNWGRKFVCSNSNHIQLVMYEDRYVARNPYLVAPSSRTAIAIDGGAADVFRTSPVEPWRIVRTELRVAGKVPGPIEGGGRAAGYFTAATGVTIYRGNAWPIRDRGIAIIGDVGSNLIHRKRLTKDGVGFKARRIDQKSEFVTSTDIWFRPVQYGNAPDGSLVVADMYREVIEHPHSLPPTIKRHLDLTSGRDRGRIYRIVPTNFKQPKLDRLDRMTSVELAGLLEHDNGWHRETAARLIYERQDRSIRQPLETIASGSKSALGKVHAIYCLQGLGLLDARVLGRLLKDPSARVREHAVRLSENHLADSPALRDKICKLAADSDLRVRYQTAFTLGEFQSASSTAALVRIAVRDSEDGWLRTAVLSSCAGRAGDLLQQIMADKVQINQANPGLRQLLKSLAYIAGREAKNNQVAKILDSLRLVAKRDEKMAIAIIAQLTRGLSQAKSPLLAQIQADRTGQATDYLQKLKRESLSVAADIEQSEARRVDAIRSLSLLPLRDVAEVLAAQLESRQPRSVQLATVRTISEFSDSHAAGILIEAWSGMSPAVRSAAVDAIFSRGEYFAPLVEALQKEKIRLADLSRGQLDMLLEHLKKEKKVEILRKVSKMIEASEVSKRKIAAAYQGVAKMKGNATNGVVLFKKICAACHRFNGQGHNTGPDLATIVNRGAATILQSVLYPNAEVNPRYLTYRVLTTDGRTVSGMIAQETATSFTLRRAEGVEETVLREDIETLRSSGMSLMPDDLYKQLGKQEMADLISYLMGRK